MSLVTILLLIALLAYIALILYGRASIDTPSLGLALIAAILMFMR